MDNFLFYLFSALTLLGGLGVVLKRQPVTSVMFMIVSFIGMAGLFVLLDAFLVGLLQIFVYAGAVMVLFLFVVMLLEIDQPAKLAKDRLTWVAALVSLMVLLAGGWYVFMGEPVVGLFNSPWAAVHPMPEAGATSMAFTTSAKSFGFGLYTKYLLPLEIAGFLLLIAVIGVLLISKRVKASQSSCKP